MPKYLYMRYYAANFVRMLQQTQPNKYPANVTMEEES